MYYWHLRENINLLYVINLTEIILQGIIRNSNNPQIQFTTGFNINVRFTAYYNYWQSWRCTHPLNYYFKIIHERVQEISYVVFCAFWILKFWIKDFTAWIRKIIVFSSLSKDHITCGKKNSIVRPTHGTIKKHKW